MQFPNFLDGCQAETTLDIAGNTRDDVGRRALTVETPEPDEGSRAEALLSWERTDGVDGVAST